MYALGCPGMNPNVPLARYVRAMSSLFSPNVNGHEDRSALLHEHDESRQGDGQGDDRIGVSAAGRELGGETAECVRCHGQQCTGAAPTDL